MIALGFAPKDATAPLGLTAHRTQNVAILTVPEAQHASARDILRHLLLCHRSLPAFLPLAPRRTVALAVARNWVDKNELAIQDALAAVASHGQISIELLPRNKPDRTLRARAQARKQTELACRELLRILAPRDHRQTVTATRARFHALVGNDHTEVARCQDALRAGALSDWSITASGIWPPFCFSEGPS